MNYTVVSKWKDLGEGLCYFLIKHYFVIQIRSDWPSNGQGWFLGGGHCPLPGHFVLYCNIFNLVFKIRYTSTLYYGYEYWVCICTDKYYPSGKKSKPSLKTAWHAILQDKFVLYNRKQSIRIYKCLHKNHSLFM